MLHLILECMHVHCVHFGGFRKKLFWLNVILALRLFVFVLRDTMLEHEFTI